MKRENLKVKEVEFALLETAGWHIVTIRALCWGIGTEKEKGKDRFALTRNECRFIDSLAEAVYMVSVSLFGDNSELQSFAENKLKTLTQDYQVSSRTNLSKAYHNILEDLDPPLSYESDESGTRVRTAKDKAYPVSSSVSTEELALLETIKKMLLEIRSLAQSGFDAGLDLKQSRLMADLADSIHNGPDAIEKGTFGLYSYTKEIMFGGFEEQYPGSDYPKPLEWFEEYLGNLKDEI